MGLDTVILLPLLMQAQPAAAPDIGPTLEIFAQAEIDSLEIEQDGPVLVEFSGQPVEDLVEDTQRSAPPGERSYRDLTVRYHGQLYLADPLARAMAGGEADGADGNDDDTSTSQPGTGQ